MKPPSARVKVRPAQYPVSAAVVADLLDGLTPPLEGKTVLLKPNCLMAAPPEKGVTTHPTLVGALVDFFRKKGARVWVGDNPGARGYGGGEECFREAGLLEAAGDAFVDIGRHPVKVPIRSRFLEQVVVSRQVLEADYVVSVPKLKTHCLTLLTGAVKNMYGILAGGEKVRIHSLARGKDDFAEAIVDVFSLRPPDLAVMDGVVAMEGDGPSHGPTRQVGLLLAADNAVAADGAAARLMGVPPRKIKHLSIADERGFGPLDGETVSVDGGLSAVAGFKLPTTFRLSLSNVIANRIVFSYLHRSRLQVDREECVQCGECASSCPAGAVKDGEEGYAINKELCHQCFCCYELCPEGAVKVRGPLGAMLKK